MVDRPTVTCLSPELTGQTARLAGKPWHRVARPPRARPREIEMPQKTWSDKRERQYEHIKDSYEDRGVSEDEAEERAARTVNKERSEHGETKQQRSKR
jgi:hypothetical protein